MSDPNNESIPPVPPAEPGGYAAPAGGAQAAGYSQQPGAYSQQPGAYSQQPGYGQQPGYAQPAYGTPGPTKTLSLISMITGIVGVVSVGYFLPASIAALILGYMGKKREGQAARGFWLTGIITGWVGVGLTVVFVGGLILFAIIAAASVPSYQY